MPPRINVPPLTRGLLLLLLTFTLLNASLRYRQWGPSDHSAAFSTFNVPYLTIVPAQSLKFPWTLITATLVEENVFSFLASGLTLFYGGRYLERAWGGPEFAKFVAFVTVIPNLLSWAIYGFWYMATGNSVRSYGLPSPTISTSPKTHETNPGTLSPSLLLA